MRANIHVDEAVLPPRGIDDEIDENRSAERPARPVVEATVVLRTFDDVVDHHAVGEMRLLVGAVPVGCEELVTGASIDGERPA